MGQKKISTVKNKNSKKVKSSEFDFNLKLKEVQDKALKIVLNDVNSRKEFFPLRYNFENVISLSKYDKLVEAKKLLDKLIKFQTKRGDFEFKSNGLVRRIDPVYFLLCVTKYVSNAKQNDKKVIKNYIKPIKRAIIFLEKNLDQNFLLFGTRNIESIKFKSKTNAVIISFVNELSDLLNEMEYNKLADTLFLLKGKLELGFKRYFWNCKYEVLLKSFKSDFSFKIASKEEMMEVLSYDHFDIDFLKKFLKEEKDTILEEKNMLTILNYLYLLKQVNLKEFKALFSDLFSVLEHLSKTQLKKEEFEVFESISNSLHCVFKLNEVGFHEFSKNKVLVGIDSVEVANKILKVRF